MDTSAVVGVSQLAVGVTHTRFGLDPWDDPVARRRGESLLHRVASYQNQAIYGWGALNPEPQPGVYDWESLDRRMAEIKQLGGNDVITLCCAPDWMTSLGTTTSSYPNLPPTPDHYDDFAALAAAVARRYPYVHYFQVWNELKGFWDRGSRMWDYVGYTDLYNRVYGALKSVNPNIQVGGPYLPIGRPPEQFAGAAQSSPLTDSERQVLQYWLAHMAGADFLAIDADSNSPQAQAGPAVEDFALTRRFADIASSVRAMTSLPIWYSEAYVQGGPDPHRVAALLASMLYYQVRGGVSVSLRWQPVQRDDVSRGEEVNSQALITDTRTPAGGQPLPNFAVYQFVHKYFSSGTALRRVTVSSSGLEALATRRRVMIVNEENQPRNLTLIQRPADRKSEFLLRPYEVVVISLSPRGHLFSDLTSPRQ